MRWLYDKLNWYISRGLDPNKFLRKTFYRQQGELGYWQFLHFSPETSAVRVWVIEGHDGDAHNFECHLSDNVLRQTKQISGKPTILERQVEFTAMIVD